MLKAKKALRTSFYLKPFFVCDSTLGSLSKDDGFENVVLKCYCPL